jgi:hypothetical protein
MKKYTLAILFCLSVNFCSAQFLKNLGKKIKEDAGWRVRNKTDNEVRKGLDSVFDAPKKIKEKKKEKNNKATADAPNDNNNTPTKQNQNPSGNLSSSTSNENDVQQKDGFITLKLSANTIFTGGSIRISGESVKYKNLNQVEITVSGPTKDITTIQLNADGKFISAWNASDKTGAFIVTVKGSDKKSMQSAKFTVYALPRLGDLCDENINVVNKAYDKLKEEVQEVNGRIGSKDKAELDKKMSDVKEKTDDLLKLFKDLNTAGKDVAHAANSGRNLSPNLADNLSELNNRLSDERNQMKQVEDYENHTASDFTVCEYLVAVNEACAAFSVYTNFESKALYTIIESITLDKAVPTAVGVLANNRLTPEKEFDAKEGAKIFATALYDSKSFYSKLGQAGFAGDVAQFATGVLINKYCGVFTGTVNHDYKIEFRNNARQNWWTYGVELKGVLSLRYPKENAKGDIIKMKGTLEGNATKFTFFEDIEKEDDFRAAGKGIALQVIPIKTFTPLAVSFATSERDIMGFGALARGLATPAYFNFGVDADYDVNTNKIKIFLTQTTIDFTSYVANVFVFVMIGMDQLPYIRHMTFPIHTVKLTLGSLIKEHNEFDVKDAKGHLSFEGKYNKHIGNKTSERETDLNFTIAAKKQ